MRRDPLETLGQLLAYQKQQRVVFSKAWQEAVELVLEEVPGAVGRQRLLDVIESTREVWRDAYLGRGHRLDVSLSQIAGDRINDDSRRPEIIA